MIALVPVAVVAGGCFVAWLRFLHVETAHDEGHEQARLRHDLEVVRKKRDSAYKQLDHNRADLRAERIRFDRLRGENRDLLARVYDQRRETA